MELIGNLFHSAVDEDSLLLEQTEENNDREDKGRNQEWEIEHAQIVGLVDADAVLALPALGARA